MKEEIIQQMTQYIAGSILQHPGQAIDPDEPLLSSGIIDSFSLVDLSIFIENTFGVRIEDTELNADTFDSLSQLADIVLQRQP